MGYELAGVAILVDRYRVNFHLTFVKRVLKNRIRPPMKPWTDLLTPFLFANLALWMSNRTPLPPLLNAPHLPLSLVSSEMLAWPVVPWGGGLSIDPRQVLQEWATTARHQRGIEQLRKLGKLQCYYLDKFNLNGVFICHKQTCKAALQSGPRSKGVAPSRSVLVPGNCSTTA